MRQLVCLKKSVDVKSVPSHKSESKTLNDSEYKETRKATISMNFSTDQNCT
jgi:hypothetical protein